MRVLVMGGTQFNGLALVHHLVESGHEVTVCNRGRSVADIPPTVNRLVADRTEHEQLREVLGGTEWDCVQDMTAYHPDDVEVMVDLFEGSVGHYVFASSTVTYAESNTLPIGEKHPDARAGAQIEYGMHKLLCEDVLLKAHSERGFPFTSAAFSMVFGPHNSLFDREQRMFARLEHGRPILIPGSGSTFTQHGHVDDQARALTEMMGRSVTFGRRYNLTGKAIVSDIGYVEACAAAVGAEARVVHVPAALMDDLWDNRIELSSTPGGGSRMDTRTRGDVVPDDPALVVRRFLLTTATMQRLAPNLHRWDRTVMFDIARLQQDIGFEPRYDFSAMTEQTYDWYSREGIAAQRSYDWSMEDEILSLIEPQS